MLVAGDLVEPVDSHQTFKIVGRYDTPEALLQMVDKIKTVHFGNIKNIAQSASYPCYLIKDLSVPFNPYSSHRSESNGVFIVESNFLAANGWEKIT